MTPQALLLCIGCLFTLVNAECDARSLITKHEGKRSCVYKDTRGIPTIGIGYNLDNPGARKAIAAVGADFDKVLAGTQCLTDSQIMQLFEPSYQSAVGGARSAVSSFDSLCCNVQEVMTDMDYNLGDAGFASFSTFISLINQKEWASAAADGKGTAWCGQVGSRCSEDMSMVAGGCGGSGPSVNASHVPNEGLGSTLGGCSNPGHCGRAYQACCIGFGAKGYPCGCHLSDGGSGQEGAGCGDCGSAYQLCCAGYAAKGYPCTCDVLPGTVTV